MTLYLIRHGQAGHKSDWSGPDHKRPLSIKGRAQADRIAEQFTEAGITRVLTSPSQRCRETVEPLAEQVGAEVETDDRLAEDTPVRGAVDLVGKLVAADETAALCSHGDVIPELIRKLHRDGLEGDGHVASAKGGTFVLETEGGQITRSRYVPPPDVDTTDTGWPKRR